MSTVPPCEHGVRHPWACDACDEASLARLRDAALDLYEALRKTNDALYRYLEIGPTKGVRKDAIEARKLATAALARVRGEQP